MGRPPARRRITASKAAASGITVQEKLITQEGRKPRVSHLVQGWKEEGKWKRKYFKERAEAERFAALKRVEMENEGRNLAMTLSSLSEGQTREAEDAFARLGETYSLRQAVDFFLENHRPPEFTITVSEAQKLYLDHKERDGNRPRTIRGKEGVLKAFASGLDDPQLHQVTPQAVEKYLRSLRAADGISPAKRKSWNTHRNEISQFFDWCAEEDLFTNRPWCFTNPVAGIRVFTARQVAEQRPPKATTDPERLCEMLTSLMRQDGGRMVKFFALSYFAGIRPEGELEKLSDREAELVNLKTGRIFIPAAISKTKADRQVVISENLMAWLRATEGKPVIPVNFKALHAAVRKRFDLKRDETRHSFISYHVALHRSIGDAALQAGNSESMVRQHYLNLHTKEEGEAFFSVMPDPETKEAYLSKVIAHPEVQKLRAI